MSWYPSTKLNRKQIIYLKLLQNIFNVKDASDNWVPYKLQPHQIHWHSQDVAVMREKAKDRIDVKSRNTSFTVSSIISNLMAVPCYDKQIIPFIRLNKERAIDLLTECKDIIAHMTPIRLKDGRLFPFDPSKVYIEKMMSITFPNGTEFRAMPANAASAESIRGMRIMGSAGMVDEGNFMKAFQVIYIALRDAARGSSKEGNKEFQMNIGTTRKGRMTSFNIWYEDVFKSRPKNLMFFSWPVLNKVGLDLNKSLLEQDLQDNVIVPWHDLQDLENKRLENLNTFKEEYMAILVDSEEQLYPHHIIEACINPDLEKQDGPIDGEIYCMGIDPAATHDLFAISTFEKYSKQQRDLFYETGTPLPTMEKYCISLIEKWKPVRVVIDGNGLGYQLAQALQTKYGNSMIKVIRGTAAVKILSKHVQNIPMKEFVHTNMIKMMNFGEIELLQDEMQERHYMQWNNDYTCKSSVEYGHGDCVIANGFALLPDNFQFGVQKVKIMSSQKKEEIEKNDKILENIKNIKEEEIKW